MDLPPFERTECRCHECSAWCFASPGGLAPSDLPNIVPKGPDGDYSLEWCRNNLLLTLDTIIMGRKGICRVPVLIPGFKVTKEIDGEQHDALCVFFEDGNCSIHDHSPWGCRMFGGDLTPVEEEARSRAQIMEIIDDFHEFGPYCRICAELAICNIEAPPKDKRLRHRDHVVAYIKEKTAEKIAMN